MAVKNKEEKKNFECNLCEPGEAVFSSKQGICGHITKKHKMSIDDSCFSLTSKKARPKIYTSSQNKKRNRQIKGGGGALDKASSINNMKNKQGTIEIPIILRIPFHFEVPEISQGIEPQMIDLGKSKKKKG